MTTEITTTVQKVQDYKGPSTFIQKMKEVILKKGSLSPKQEEVVFNILNKGNFLYNQELLITLIKYF